MPVWKLFASWGCTCATWVADAIIVNGKMMLHAEEQNIWQLSRFLARCRTLDSREFGSSQVVEKESAAEDQADLAVHDGLKSS